MPAVVIGGTATGFSLLVSASSPAVSGSALEGGPVLVPAVAEVGPAGSAVAERVRARPASRSVVRPVVAKSSASATARRMSAVVRFARSKVGARYGTSRGRYDCSKLTQAAYRSAGVRLPRTSGAQAGRAYRVSWSSARPGDLIVGRGHVGIYMGKRHGRHMMIDAGNRRVGVSYRAVYFNRQGLHPERVRVR